MSKLDDLREYVDSLGTAPTLEEMPRRRLEDKGIHGPTGAHVIEEIHNPFNFAYIAVTTGSTAFQNITGVTKFEISDRVLASIKAFELSNIKKGAKVLFTYPPLVNVFTKDSLVEYGLEWSFLKRSSRDALILAMCEEKPDVVVGESTFLNATLEDAKKIDMLDIMPRNTVFLTAGTPLDLDLLETAKRLVNGTVHDLYGCQEFGWLTLDGIELRPDISLINSEDDGYVDLIVGGLPTGDRFPYTDKGHACNPSGKIITYGRERTHPEFETTILETTANAAATVDRLARTILRIKSRIVRVSPDLKVNQEKTVVSLRDFDGLKEYIISDKTNLIDSLLLAQLEYQSQQKTDPTWIKKR